VINILYQMREKEKQWDPTFITTKKKKIIKLCSKHISNRLID
jgi:hypothetical protein